MPDFQTLALARSPVRMRLASIEDDFLVLPLWEERDMSPGKPHPRPGTWRVLAQDAGGDWRSSVLHPDDCEVLQTIGLLPPVVLTAGEVVSGDDRIFIETLSVARRFGLRASFAYAKKAGPPESRRGIPCGFRLDNVYTFDSDRGGELRMFKRGGITHLQIDAGQEVPTWGACGYALPAPERAL